MAASKVFLVSRADLSDAQQGVQAMHALTEFIFEHPKIAGPWRQESNTLAWLVVPDEAALGVLLKKAVRRDIPASSFREPDMNNEMTAIALGPSARSLVSGLPLTFAAQGAEAQRRAASF